jgi:hypothetical protein
VSVMKGPIRINKIASLLVAAVQDNLPKPLPNPSRFKKYRMSEYFDLIME